MTCSKYVEWKSQIPFVGIQISKYVKTTAVNKGMDINQSFLEAYSGSRYFEIACKLNL